MYKAYCASCHGSDAKGHGPAAPALKTPPPDLTVLAKGNQGKYPAFRVVAAIRLGDVTSHGSREMPVWGEVLGSIGNATPREVELRVTNLTRYIESLQQK
jgi:mono/diheme cytochrome c family protein